jgi:hypothetical protein
MLPTIEGVEDWAYQTIALDQYMKVNQGVSKVMISDEAKLYFA